MQHLTTGLTSLLRAGECCLVCASCNMPAAFKFHPYSPSCVLPEDRPVCASEHKTLPGPEAARRSPSYRIFGG